MTQPRPDARQRLAVALQRLRTDAGLSQAQLAAAVGISQPTVTRMEKGTHKPSSKAVNGWLDAVQATTKARTEVLALAADAAVKVEGWRTMFRGGMAATQQAMRAADEAAVEIQHVQPFVVPGHWQPHAYARAAIAGYRLTVDNDRKVERDLDAAADARIARGNAMRARAQVPYHVVVTELGLRMLPLGVTVAMRSEAIRAMAHDAEHLDHVTVQVVPAEAPVLQVPVCGWIAYRQSAEADDLVVIQVETPGALITLSSPADVAPFDLAWQRWRDSALPPAESVRFLRTLTASE